MYVILCYCTYQVIDDWKYNGSNHAGYRTNAHPQTSDHGRVQFRGEQREDNVGRGNSHLADTEHNQRPLVVYTSYTDYTEEQNGFPVSQFAKLNSDNTIGASHIIRYVCTCGVCYLYYVLIVLRIPNTGQVAAKQAQPPINMLMCSILFLPNLSIAGHSTMYVGSSTAPARKKFKCSSELRAGAQYESPTYTVVLTNLCNA